MNILKKIILITNILLYLFLGFYSFAQTTIDLHSNGKEFDINDPIKLEININPDNSEQIKLEEIKGLDDFQIIGQNQSQSFHSINGKSSIEIKLLYNIKANNKGEYTIGPVIIEEGQNKLKSNTINIKVTGEQIFIGNSNNIQNNTSPNNSVQNNPNNSSQEPIVNQELNKDIKGIKENITPSFISYYRNVILLFVFIIILLIYLYFKAGNSSNTEIKDEKTIKINEKNINYGLLLNEIKEKYIDSNKEIFYTKIGGVFQKYIHDKMNINLYNKTFQETKDLLDYKLLQIWQDIYYYKYNTETDNIEKRKKIIDNLLNIFK